MLTVRQLDPELALFNARARVLAEQITVAANLTVRRGRLVRVFQLGFNLCDRERKTVSVLWLPNARRQKNRRLKVTA